MGHAVALIVVGVNRKPVVQHADTPNILFRPNVRQANELAAQAKQTAKNATGLGLLLLPCAKSVLIILIDDPGYVSGCDLAICRIDEIQPVTCAPESSAEISLIGWLRC